ncbi:MAG TPA: 1,4-dihydroxy-2-naphthoate polyprenyltransferase [Opitutaceae bacterium]|nr:1,4-dihydroxy-2-naphthoate polyprenyltransferase [Opitutaceae bacterium]
MTPSRFQIWFGAARPRTLPAAVAPVLVGAALAWRDGVFSAGAVVLCLGFALLVQIGTNFANDYYDFIKGADTAARVGPQRAVAAGLVSPLVMKRAMGTVFLAAFLVGLGLLAWGGPWLLAVGIASIVCGAAYTGGPCPLGYLGLGDIFVFLFFGLVAVCTTYFVQAGSVTFDAVLAATGIGALAANILVVNNYRDVETDAAAGKRTLVVRFGRGFARAQFAVSLILALLIPFGLIAGGQRWTVLLPLLLAPLAWRHVRRLRESKTPAELIALLGDTGKFLALYAVLFSAGVALAK